MRPIDFYDENSTRLADRFEAASPDAVNGWLLDLLSAPGRMVDIGAGSGRDAAWFAAQGWEVLAIEPAAGMRREAGVRRPEDRVRWIDDCLPDLATVSGLEIAADVVLLNAVWMFIDPVDRAKALQSMAALLTPGGLLAMSFKENRGAEPPASYPCAVADVVELGACLGLRAERIADSVDAQARPGVSWKCVALRKG